MLKTYTHTYENDIKKESLIIVENIYKHIWKLYKKESLIIVENIVTNGEIAHEASESVFM